MIDQERNRLATRNPPVVRSRLLGELSWLRHGVTMRVPGMGSAEGNVGYTAPRDVEDAWAMRRRWVETIGLDPDRIARVHQVHGDAVAVASREDGLRGGRPGSTGAPPADAIITGTPGLALMTLHADCVALLLADPEHRVVAAVHAGWRGTLVDVAGATVRRMSAEFGSRPSRIVAFIGPGIGVSHYEVGAEVVQAFEERWPASGALQRRASRTHLDLKTVNLHQLVRAGMRQGVIESSPLCTVRDQDRLFSHRAQGATTGRFAAIIGIVDQGSES